MDREPLHEKLRTAAPINQVAQTLVDETNRGNEAARWWIEPVIRFGLSNQLMHDIARELEDVEIPMKVVLAHVAKEKKSRFFLMYSGLERLTERQLFAFTMTRLVTEDFLKRLRQCRECRTYFIGNSRAKWCSTTCGSKHRVYKKRRRERKKKGAKT